MLASENKIQTHKRFLKKKKKKTNRTIKALILMRQYKTCGHCIPFEKGA